MSDHTEILKDLIEELEHPKNHRDCSGLERIISRISQLESALSEARNALDLCGGMAGNPDAKEGCRLICKKVNEVETKIKEILGEEGK